MSSRGSATTSPRSSNRITIILAILLGLVAAAMNWAYTSRTAARQLTVLRAKERVPAGTPVRESMFEPVSIWGDLAQMRRLVVAQPDFRQVFNNKPVAETLQPGQLLLLRSFELSGEDVRESIRPGERALSINVPDEAQAVAYFVRPGDAVDVWGWVDGVAHHLKPGACVRAVGDSYRTNVGGDDGEEGRQYRTVTIIVSEQDVEGLVSNLFLSGDDVKLSLIGPCEGAPGGAALPAIPLARMRKGTAAAAAPAPTPDEAAPRQRAQSRPN